MELDLYVGNLGFNRAAIVYGGLIPFQYFSLTGQSWIWRKQAALEGIRRFDLNLSGVSIISSKVGHYTHHVKHQDYSALCRPSLCSIDGALMSGVTIFDLLQTVFIVA